MGRMAAGLDIAAGGGVPAGGAFAREVMTPGVVTIVEDASVRRARGTMRAHGLHALLVVRSLRGSPTSSCSTPQGEA